MSHGCETVVVGGGPGGYLAALRLAQGGRDVLLVEARERLGGVCLNEGCIPSKALIHAANLAAEARGAGAMGIDVGEVRVDLARLVGWKDGIVERLTGGVGGLTEAAGVARLTGRARFVGRRELVVETAEGPQRVSFDNAVIATGTAPVTLDALPFDGERVIGSREALSPTSLPERLAVVGAGYIGLELGLVYAKLGVEVHIVDIVPALMPDLDPAAGKLMARVLRKLGATLHLGKRVVADEGDALTLAPAADDAESGDTTRCPCDRVLVCVGRRPLSDDLGLAEAGVELSERGHIVVDEHQQTTAAGIYAIGDVVDGPPLAHKAYREAEVAAANICGDALPFDNQVIPAVVYTDPEIAWVGLSERDAEALGFAITTGRFPLSASGRAMTLGAEAGFIKVVAERDTERLLGVLVVAPNASELIGEATLAIEMGACVDDIADTIHAHPTLSEGLQEAAHIAMGRGVHIRR